MGYLFNKDKIIKLEQLFNNIGGIFSVIIFALFYIGIVYYSFNLCMDNYKDITKVNNHSIINGYLQDEYTRVGKKRQTS